MQNGQSAYRAYFANIWNTLKSITIGMQITLKYCFARTVTVQYPDMPPTLQPRFRGFHWYEIEKCSACKACARACPVLNYFFGEPLGVRALLSNAVHRGRVEDCATLMIDYKSHVRGIVDVRWNSHVPQDEFTIAGSLGQLDLTPLNGPSIIYPGGREELPPHSNLHFPCIQNFAGAVLDGAPLLSSGESAQWTDWVTQKAVEDSRR